MLKALLRPAFRQLRNGSRRQFHHVSIKKSSNIFVITSLTGLSGYFLYDNYLNKVNCAQPEKVLKSPCNSHKTIREELPFFTEEELSRHNNKEVGIWVSYGVGVYDISKLIDKHGNPNETILLAAGMALDPYWEDEDMKKIHEKPYIFSMMEKCRIGNLKVSVDDN